MKPVLFTPKERFANLPDYDYKENYVTVRGMKMHYVDDGSENADPVLLLHGEPSWSYLYRKMIPPLVKAGHRVVAPDLIGFGKSDKFCTQQEYNYQFHIDSINDFVKELDLQNITMFIQDWGGLIGLRVLALNQDRFARVVAANTMLPAARGYKARIGYPLFKLRIKLAGKVDQKKLSDETNFLNWVAFSRTAPDFPVGEIIQGATVSELSPEVVAAYDAPFPDESFKAAARIFPFLVPSQLKENQEVWDNVLSKWEKPFLTLFSDKDPITRGGEKYFIRKVPGAQNQKHQIIKNAGHFLQEEKGEELAELVIQFISENKQS